MSRSDDDQYAFREHALKEATQKFLEVIRKNTPEYDSLPRTEDQAAMSDDAILQAAKEFNEETKESHDPSFYH